MKLSHRFLLSIVAGATSFTSANAVYAQADAGIMCAPDEEFCYIPPQCLAEEFANCYEAPKPCEPTANPPFEFIGNDQIYAVHPNRNTDCAVIRVQETGYYSIYDNELSESCADQLDEIGYLTITNSCNGDGWAIEGNAGDRFVVDDVDNVRCEEDTDCRSGEICRSNGHGKCCVPDQPVFMGTFLLVEGEDNEICINHWCKDWKEAQSNGMDLGLVNAECEGSPNSIHFKLGADALACQTEDYLTPCAWGCNMGTCLPDPCEAMDCGGQFCKDGVCMATNPCETANCPYGCTGGYCLQPPGSRGPDADNDGYTELSDCNDNDAEAHPDHDEVCDNGKDDNCDGIVDEANCGPGTSLTDRQNAQNPNNMGTVDNPLSDVNFTPDGGARTVGDTVAEGKSPGCHCRIGTSQSAGPWALLLLLGLVAMRRRR